MKKYLEMEIEILLFDRQDIVTASIPGENDKEEEADALGRLLRGKNCHVNLIPVNPIKEREYKQSSFKNVLNFRKRLEKYNINVTIRRELGADIGAACGQLRKSHLDEASETGESL